MFLEDPLFADQASENRKIKGNYEQRMVFHANIPIVPKNENVLRQTFASSAASTNFSSSSQTFSFCYREKKIKASLHLKLIST